jgi:signal transduction histidine kinase
MSLYLARDFARTRRHLEVQLHQVQELSRQTRRQEAERQQLISAQNEQLESTVQRRTEEIRQQNTVLATQKAAITAQADQLRALDEAKSRFFTNITHEFRPPSRCCSVRPSSFSPSRTSPPCGSTPPWCNAMPSTCCASSTNCWI